MPTVAEAEPGTEVANTIEPTMNAAESIRSRRGMDRTGRRDDGSYGGKRVSGRVRVGVGGYRRAQRRGMPRESHHSRGGFGKTASECSVAEEPIRVGS
ncbi:hypothetical protein GCM10009747_27880 [Agromyces humatus]|uniref:Uncharacterized protein n=1 Tax=Agromyces humatus TaxID=279573 RepID=A0ABN2KU02_9MICO